MAYSEFTMATVRSKLGLVVHERADLFSGTPGVALPADLAALLAINLPLAIDLVSEKARSELLVSPIVFRLRHLYPDRLSVFSGVQFDVDAAKDLNGRCDYLVARNPSMLEVISPVCVLVEAKAENIVAGIPQCLAEMAAAHQFNAAAGVAGAVFGCVTAGLAWRFLKLEETDAYVEGVEYPISHVEKVFGILTRIALGPAAAS